eukprot:gene29236-4886_t
MFLFVSEGPESYLSPWRERGQDAKQDPQLKEKKQKPPYFATLKHLFMTTRLMALVCTMCGFLYGIRTMFLLYAVSYLNE